MKRLILLYPKAWRNRYEREFVALLEDVPASWTTLFDVLGGALKMQMKIWSSWKIVAAFAIAGLLFAIGSALMIPNRYVSMAIIKTGDVGPENLANNVDRIESRGNLARLINEEDLYQSERTREPIEDIIQQMRQKDIRVASVKSRTGEAGVISISFASPDAAQAQRATRRLTSQFLDANVGTLLDPASLPIHPVSPKRPMILMMGLLAGLGAGLLFVFFHGLKMWKHAALLGISGAILAGAASYLMPERFSSSAALAYRPADQERIPQMIGAVTSSDSLHAMVQKFGLYPNDSRADRRLSEHLHIQQIPNRQAILIQFDYPDQHVAQNVTQNVVAQFVKLDWNLEIVDRPNFPQTPFSPNRSTAAGLGLALGLAIATVVGIREQRIQHA
jgi:LPS O-antigen subunit length determinant protein (WzzB/FepE family)